jgi:hypothetical protein
MARNKATITGFLAAPLVSAMIGSGQTTVAGGLGLTAFIGLLPIMYLFSLFATILLGVPMYIVLNRLNLISWWLTIGVGIGIGAMMAVIFVFPNTVQLKGLVLMSIMGGSSGLTFWLTWFFGSEQTGTE